MDFGSHHCIAQIKRLGGCRVKRTKARKDRLWPKPQRARLAGVIMIARFAHDLEIINRRTSGCEQRKCLSFGIKGVEFGCFAVSPAARCFIASKHNPCGQRFGVGQIAPPNFKQPHTFRTAINIAPRRRKQTGEERGPHHLHVFADRVGEAPMPSPKSSSLFFGQE